MKDATLSPCRRYRYALWREWLMGDGTCLFVMLNPSTADGDHDDATVRRCISFAQRWGYRRLAVANLFALRSTDPKLLKTSKSPIGPDNDRHIHDLAAGAAAIYAAWGALPDLFSHRERHVRAILRAAGPPVRVLALTKNGHPRHPLYLAGTVEPQDWAA